MVLFLFFADPAVGQLSRVDSIIAKSIPEMVQPLAGGPTALSSDTSLVPLLAIAARPAGMCLQTFFIDNLSAVYSDDSGRSTINVEVRGVLLVPGSLAGKQYVWSKSISITLSPAERQRLIANNDRYVRYPKAESSSFWSTVLEPGLVLIGAAAIIALFFMLRS